MKKTRFPLIVGLFLCALPASADQNSEEAFSMWPTDLKINGTVIACSGGKISPKVFQTFRRSAGGDEARIVVIDFGSEFAEQAVGKWVEKTNSLFSVSFAEVPESLSKALIEALRDATGIFLVSEGPLEEKAVGLLELLADPIQGRIGEGAVVCAIGPVTSRLGRITMESKGDRQLHLIPDTLIRAGYVEDRDQPWMMRILGENPRTVGIGIPPDTAIILNGRKITVFGDDGAAFLLPENDHLPKRVERIKEAEGLRPNPYETVADLTAWRRDAIERTQPAFPVGEPPVPHVEKGTLIIVGGGGTPKGLMERMVEMAGGKDAKMIYVPCTEEETVSSDSGPVGYWKKLGVDSAVVFHTKDRGKANSDEEFLAPLKVATGIWFGGGRQWNFADSYYGTKAHRLMKEVLSRGGVIGGSSAGASIQADYLARANPVANFDIMAPGYERGLGFLEGVAIDQHFSQRGRQKDMTQLVKRYPQLLGIGIDEATALTVRGSLAEIVGSGKVYFYDGGTPKTPGEPDFTALGDGHAFDLAKRVPAEIQKTNPLGPESDGVATRPRP